MTEKKVSRRKFLKASSLCVLGGAAAFGLATVPVLRSETVLLRPPGALDEGMFLASCIKCGQCVQVCPPQILLLDGLRGGYSIGTPYLVPREGACVLCAGLPCILACPTGALSQEISEGKEAAMGLAVLSRPDQCLASLGTNDLNYRLEDLKEGRMRKDYATEIEDLLNRLVARATPEERQELQNHFGVDELKADQGWKLAGKMKKDDLDWLLAFSQKSQQAQTGCRICLDDCPIKKEKPIVFETRNNPSSGKEEIYPKVTQTCVGCGVCEEKCPTPEPCITIVPRMQYPSKEVSHG